MATPTLEQVVLAQRDHWAQVSQEQRQREIDNNIAVAEAYDLLDEVPTDVPLERVSLNRNSAFRWPTKTPEERDALFIAEAIEELISYAVGCMFGRYSLDVPGLILADQGSTLQDYLAKVPSPSFRPDADGVLPIIDGDWFDDDIVSRFREFLKVAFGEANLNENVRFIEVTLGKSIRQYFVRDFYKNHVQRYKNRPIYWMFSSRPDGNGAFNALIYLHRYTPATVNTVLNEYLRELQEKVRGTIASLDRQTDAASKKKADALRPMLTECSDYERDVLYPLALRNVEIDLDDGVLVNYLRFGKALVKIKAIEDKRSTVEDWTWPKNPLTRDDA